MQPYLLTPVLPILWIYERIDFPRRREDLCYPVSATYLETKTETPAVEATARVILDHGDVTLANSVREARGAPKVVNKARMAAS